MQELLLIGNKGRAGIDISFEDHDVGSKSFVDKNWHPFSLVGNLGATGGVVNDPAMGKCFYFPGTAYFQTPMVKDLQLAGKIAMIEAVFKWEQGGSQGSVWETGNYPSGRPPTPGIALSVGQYPATYIQYFCMLTNGQWIRGLPPNTTNIGVWETVKYNKAADGSGPMTVERDGALFSSFSMPAGTIGNGSALSVGGSYTWGGYWKGWLKSLKISIM